MSTSRKPPDPEDVRMTLGEHLEELRGRLLRALVALVAACLLCIWPAKYLLELIARPVMLVLEANDQPTNFLQTHPVEVVLIYIKVVVIAGLVISAPYVIWQIWGFVAAGLYEHEKSYVYRLVPFSVGLFLLGVAFMYVFVLLVSLNFLVGFSNWIPLPDTQPMAWERALLHAPPDAAPTTQPDAVAPVVPVLAEDPPSPPVGAVWFNARDRKLKLHGGQQTYSLQLMRDGGRGMIATHFKIGDYLSFILIMTIAFGLAFQMPLVVFFLATSGLVEIETFRKYRKIVILVIIFIAGMLAPPDLLSHLLLSGPMILLFELGLWLAARRQRRSSSSASANAATP